MLSPEEVQKRKEELEKRRALKKQYRRRRLLMYGLVLFFGLVLMGITAYYSYQQGVATPVSQVNPGDRRINILFMGIDEKLSNSNVRTDTVMLVSLDPSNGEVGVLSIPRDTRVYINSRQRWDRVNTAYAYGGPNGAMEAASQLLGIPVEYYVKTDFGGFHQIVDTLGGVEIDVEREMFYVDNAQDLRIHLLPGRQRLDGDQALQYVRFRDRLGDISLVDPIHQAYDGRVERQRKFVQALLKEILHPRVIPKIPTLITQLWNVVDTNLPWDRVLNLAMAANRFSVDNIKTAVLPGTAGQVNGASYWVADQARVKPIVDHITKGEPLPLRVAVLNGNGQAGSASLGRDLLVKHGYDVVNLGNADHYNYPQTQIIIGNAALTDRATQLASVINGEVVLRENFAQRVDATVIIGRNFRVE